jgi:hypothetical protein
MSRIHFVVSGTSLALTLIAATVAAQAPAATRERCDLLIATFDRYYPKKDAGLGSTGSRLDRDIAEARCQQGRYDEGIRSLEIVMRRNDIPIPPG